MLLSLTSSQSSLNRYPRELRELLRIERVAAMLWLAEALEISCQSAFCYRSSVHQLTDCTYSYALYKLLYRRGLRGFSLICRLARALAKRFIPDD